MNRSLFVVLFLAGLFAYCAFLLWTPKKQPDKTPNRPISFLVGFVFAILLYYVNMLGIIAGSFVGGVITTFVPFWDSFSYVLAAVCGLLLSAHTIKILPSKISELSFHYFKSISFVLYLVFGIYMILNPALLPGNPSRFIIIGISYVCISLSTILINRTKKDSYTVTLSILNHYEEEFPSPAWFLLKSQMSLYLQQHEPVSKTYFKRHPNVNPIKWTTNAAYKDCIALLESGAFHSDVGVLEPMGEELLRVFRYLGDQCFLLNLLTDESLTQTEKIVFERIEQTSPLSSEEREKAEKLVSEMLDAPSSAHKAASSKVVSSFHFSPSKQTIVVISVVAALLAGLALGIFLGEGYFSPYFTPSSPYINSLKEEAETAYSNGYNVGYTLGKRTGYDSGTKAGQSKGYSYGYADGYSDGFSDGYFDGYNEGYDDCYYGN